MLVEGSIATPSMSDLTSSVAMFTFEPSMTEIDPDQVSRLFVL